MSRLVLITAFSIALGPSSSVLAQTRAMSAEAEVYFKRGNALFEQARRSPDPRKTRLLERSLEAYAASLRIVRSRNALFNAAVVFEELGRFADAFNYYTEYVGIEELGEVERAQAERRRDDLRARVATVVIQTEPRGATCWVDRIDTGPLGKTPLELALDPGKHQVLLRKEGYESATLDVDAILGAQNAYSLTLTPKAVTLVVETEEPLSITLDGRPISAGKAIAVPAGTHELRFGLGQNVFSRTVEVPATDRPFVVKLSVPRGLLIVHTLPGAQIHLDGAVVGRGPRLERPVIAGAHRIEVRAPTYRAEGTEVTIEERERREVTISLEKSEETRLKRAALGSLAGAGATVAMATGLSIRARSVHNDYERAAETFRQDPTQANLRRARSLKDKTGRLNLGADVFWITSAAAGVTALTLHLVKRRRQRQAERIQVSFVPSQRGVFVSAGVSLGGAP